jgi:hypothetical protein
MLGDVIEGLLEAIFHLFVETVCFFTGEMLLSFVTIGRKKVRWDYYTNESPTKFVILTEISTWTGFFFWIFTIGFIVRTFF